jgi:hypothetical protein
MSKLRWAQFFWADWRGDSALNLCSLPARGLWMELLCLAAQGEPYGTVTVKGRAPSDDELFTLTAPRGTRRRQWDRWLAELEGSGVAERDHNRAIRSPRMSHDGALSLVRMDAAKTRWGGRHDTTDAHANGEGLHMQTDSFASIEVQAKRKENPPKPPQGGARGRARMNGGGKESRNAACDIGAEIVRDKENAEPTNAPSDGSRVAYLASHPRRRQHVAE